MKKSIRKIWGIGLFIMLLASLITMPTPALADEITVVYAEAIDNMTVEVTFDPAITEEQAGAIQYTVTYSYAVKGTASGTVAEGDTNAVLTVEPPMTPQGYYRLSGTSVKFFVGEGELILDGFEHGGYDRTYELYIPSGYDCSTAVPLVFSFHGRSLYGAAMINITGFTDVAEDEGFIAVFPDSTRLLDPLGIGTHLWEGKPGFTEENFGPQWSTGKDMTFQDLYGVDDVPFVSELLDRLEAEYNIDETRIYATGWSSGGMFVSQLAVKLSDRFAGIVSASGGMLHYEELPYIPKTYIQTIGALEDESIRPAPAFTSAETAEFWADVDNCDPGVVDDTDYFIQTTYSGGIWGTEVILYVVKGQGHAWPNQQPEGLNSQTIWDILKEHALTPQAMIASAIGYLDITDLPKAIKIYLMASLNQAMKKLEDSNPKNDVAAIHAMKSFIKKIKAMRGRKIPKEIADELIARARRIIVNLLPTCGHPGKPHI